MASLTGAVAPLPPSRTACNCRIRASVLNPAEFSGRPHVRHVPTVSRVARCAAASTTGRGFGPPKQGSLKKEALKDQQEVQDRLIAAFQSKPQNTWKKMIAFSKQWPTLADGVFERLNELIKSEKDPETKLKLRRFLRSLQNAHKEVAKYAAVLKKFEEARPMELDSIVAGNRDALTPGFFEYLQDIIAAEHENQERQEELVKLGSQVAAMVEAFERTAADREALESAAVKFQDLLQVESLEAAERKIDEMAASGALDPALLLTMAKAYSGVKETDYTREEVKDLMYHLYVKGKEAAARQAPPEVRILKHLLSMEDPLQRAAELDNALQKGPELETPTQDFLSTEPQKLMLTVDTVLKAYDSSRNKGTMLGQTADLMSPDVIVRLRDIQALLRKRYM